MPIYKGNTPIVGIYKGSTEIVRRYRGADLIYESAKWLPYSFSPFILTTLPQTIDGLNVRDAQKITSLKGNSVAWNQLYYGGDLETRTISGITFTKNQNGTYTLNGTATADIEQNIEFSYRTLNSTHKYLLKGCPTGGSTTTYYIRMHRLSNYDVGNGVLENANSNGASRINIVVKNGTTINNLVFKPQLFDLTLMFGPGNEPTSVLEFTRLFPNAYYAYDAGTLRSSQASALKATGHNQFDGELEGGSIQQADGQNAANAYAFRTKNYTRAIAGQTYTFENSLTQLGTIYLRYYDISYNYIGYATGTNANTQNITIPNNVAYIRAYWFRANTDWGTNPPSQSEAQICIHLIGKTGYEPYWSETYQLPNIVLRSAGSASDELSPDGTLTRRVGIRAYQSGDENDATVITDKTNTYYALATPTTEQSTAFQEQMRIDPYGTMEMTTDIPQGMDSKLKCK